MRKALAVGRKELRQIVRDKRTLFILLLVPALLLLLYGYALNFDIRNIALAVEDRDGTIQSRRIISAFVNSGYFDLASSVESDAELERLMDTNRIKAALIIPTGTGRRVLTGQQADVQVLINGDNANTAAAIMGYASTIVRTVSVSFEARLTASPQPPLSVEPRIWYNPELRSALFLVPGLMAYIAMITAVVSTALAIVREKEGGTMEQIRMAPIGTSQFVVGKCIPYFLISIASSLGIVLASMMLFGLPMRGSWLTLMFTISLFLAGALGTGILISTIADTQQVALQAAILSSFLPTLMLSGFIFPISNMPAVLRAVTYLVPARYFLIALRGIVLKGASIGVFSIQLAALAIYAFAVLGLAAVRLARQRG